MNTLIKSFCFLSAVLVISAADTPNNQSQASSRNLAVVAVPSSSYVSGDTSLAALNDGNNPRSSRDVRQGSYGNWNRTGTQWVQYDWNQTIYTDKIEVYWWADGAGVALPKASRLLYWDGTNFVPVKNPSGLGVEGNQFNVTSFDEVATSKLRLEIDSNGTLSTGILEWRVLDSGKSPAFPPSVKAGEDRVVILGGKTYLSGSVKSMNNSSSVAVRWSKISGPGDVQFADAKALSTTASFSSTGHYTLNLTAIDGTLSASSQLQVIVDQAPPVIHLTEIQPRPYSISSPFWSPRIKAIMVNWIPHCIKKISDPNLREGGINNFIDAANKLSGKSATRHRGYVFANAWVLNTVEAICLALMVDPQGDAEMIASQNLMKSTLDDWLPKILAAQESDGYLQTAYTLSGKKRWTQKGDHEGYVAGYFLEAAIAHHIYTKRQDSQLYNAAKKLADCWYDNLGPAPKKYWYDGHQEMEQALVRFSTYVNSVEGAGKGTKYLELAKFLMDCRRNGESYDQSHLPVVQQYEALGHAVRAAYSYSGMAGVAMEMNDIDYHSATKSLWDNIINKKYYVTGGIGSGETSEGFGPNYSLRNNAYCESCSSCGMIFLQTKLNHTYHDACYADACEETLYNALLGSLDLQAKNFYYQNPLDSRGDRYDWHACPCCVGNIPKTLLMLPTWAYTSDRDNLYVNLFFGSTVVVDQIAGTDVQIIQTTDYPWSGKVKITVNPSKETEFGIKLRVPNREISSLYRNTPKSSGFISLSINGKEQTLLLEKGYALIKRDWKAGDTILLELPMPVQRVKGDEKIEATRGKVALRIGPLLYSLEKVDQDLDKVLSPDAHLTTEWKGDLLQGVKVIKGSFTDGSAMLAIPNFARNNRNTPAVSNNTTNSPAGGRARMGRPISSIVWIKDK